VNPLLLHLSHLPLKERVQDEGVFLVWDCPRCALTKDFHLIKSRTYLSLLGLEFESSKTLLDLQCAGCKYEVRASPSEITLLESAKELTDRLKGYDLTREAYLADLKALDANFIKDFVALTQNWKCPKCGEENPVSFESCWSCNSKEADTSELDDDAKPFPGMPRGGNSWE
jgi:rubredoxin